MIRFPGFIDIAAEIPAGNWQAYTNRALLSGYTTLLAAPQAEEVFTEKAHVIKALSEPAQSASCDYAKLALITPENIRSIEEWAEEVPAAMIDFDAFRDAGSFARMNLLTRLFSRWPANKPICVRGGESQVGSAVFMAQVHRRKVHVCSVVTRAEIEMINEARNSGTAVSCDVHPLSLLLSAEDPQNANGPLKRMGTEDDRRALWQYIRDIDCFSSSGFTGSGTENGAGLAIMLPLLLSMVKSEMLKMEDVLFRCCVNPARLFGIRLDPGTIVEADETAAPEPGSAGFIRSVRLHGQSVFSADEPAPFNQPFPVRASRVRGYSA